MIVPYELLEPEALIGLIEEFVSREGTDNGYESSLSARVDQVRQQLVQQKLVIVFDHASQSANILPKELAKSFYDSSES